MQIVIAIVFVVVVVGTDANGFLFCVYTIFLVLAKTVFYTTMDPVYMLRNWNDTTWMQSELFNFSIQFAFVLFAWTSDA